MSYLIAIFTYYTGDNLERFGIIKQENPVLGPIELNRDKKEEENDPLKGFFSTAEVTYEQIAIEDAIRIEQETKMLVDKFSFIHDEVYSKQDNYTNPYDNTVSLPPSFFDLINSNY